jgi:hypothetical protein
LEQNLLASNLELRSRSFDLTAVQLGMVLFHDAGDSPRTFADFHLRHSVGFGLRAVFPQIYRAVLRVDLGFPLVPDTQADRYVPGQPLPGPSLSVAFGQAFDLREVKGVSSLESDDL